MSARVVLIASVVFAICALVAMFTLLHDARFLQLTLNSLFLAVGSCAIALPLGTLLAVIIWRTDAPGHQAAAWCVVALIFLPLYLHYTGWDAGLGARGWITATIGRPLAEPLLSGWRGAIMIHGIAAVPWVAMIVALGLAGVESSLEQESLQDSRPLTVFFRVTLPQCWQSLLVAVIWIMIAVIGEMQITDMYQIRTYAEVLYMGFARESTLQEATFSQLGQMLLVGSLVCMSVGTMIYLSPRLEHTDTRTATIFSLGRCRWIASATLWLMLGAMLGFPLFNLLYQAGIESVEVDTGVERIWSLAAITRLLPSVAAEFKAELIWSFVMAATSATLALAIAAPVAWFARTSKLAKIGLIGLVAIPLAIPGPLIGIGLITLFNESGSDTIYWLYSHSIAAPVLAMLARSLPLVMLLLWRTMSRIGTDLVESASVEGASTGQQLGWFGVAGQLPSLTAAWLLGIAVSMGELAASKMTMPPGVETVTVRIFGLAHSGVDDQLAGLCLLAELIFLILAGLVYGVLRKV